MMSAGGGGGKPGARAGSRGGSPGPSGPPGNGAGGQRLPRRCPGPAGLSRPGPASAAEGPKPPPPPTPGFPQGRGRGLTFPDLRTAIKADVPSARPLPSPRAGCTQGARFSGAAFLASEATILSFLTSPPLLQTRRLQADTRPRRQVRPGVAIGCNWLSHSFVSLECAFSSPGKDVVFLNVGVKHTAMEGVGSSAVRLRPAACAPGWPVHPQKCRPGKLNTRHPKLRPGPPAAA